MNKYNYTKQELFQNNKADLTLFDLPLSRRLPKSSERVLSLISYILSNIAKPTECLHKYNFIPLGQVYELSGETR